MFLLPTILSLLVITVLGTKLPSSFMRCDRKQPDFQECLRQAVENAIQQMDKPFKEVGLPSLEPLEIPEMTIGAGNRAVAFQQNYKNLKVYGCSKIKCPKVEFDLATGFFDVDCRVAQIKMAFDYEINGRILVLPIVGKGPGLITLDDVAMDLSGNLEEYEKHGKKYYKVVSTKMSAEPKSINFKLENLFNGDKTLGDNINAVINENWREVFADVRPNYEEAFAKIFGSIFNNLLSRVPINELFENE